MMIERGKPRMKHGVRNVKSSAPESLPSSTCKGLNFSIAANCLLVVKDRSLMARGRMAMSDGSNIDSFVNYKSSYANEISYTNSGVYGEYRLSSNLSQIWSQTRDNAKTSSKILYNWMNVGSIKDQGVWINSFNFTGHANGLPTSQRHYQRLLMLNSTWPSPPTVPSVITHTVFLKSLNAADVTMGVVVLQEAAATWAAIKPNFTNVTVIQFKP